MGKVGTGSSAVAPRDDATDCMRCGIPLPHRETLYGPPRKWCSENCRKRAAADRARAACEDCGCPLGEGSLWPRTNGNPYERCRACWTRREAAARRARVEDVAAMYNEGLSVREIARELGYGENSIPPEINEARRLGLIGYRYRGYGQVAA